MVRSALLTLAASAATAFQPFQNPPWPQTYNLGLSTITMALNNSGPVNPAFGATFGIVSYDW